MNEPANFIEDRFMWLSPFSAHRIKVWGEVFPTLEHAYQWSRVAAGPNRDAIKDAPSPFVAWKLGQECKDRPDLRVEDFDKLATMEVLYRAKLAQHPELVEILLESGDREIHKVFATDYFWGTGADGSGRNEMGKLLMKLREEMK